MVIAQNTGDASPIGGNHGSKHAPKRVHRLANGRLVRLRLFEVMGGGDELVDCKRHLGVSDLFERPRLGVGLDEGVRSWGGYPPGCPPNGRV